MLKRALFLLMVMLTVPTIASAVNYWSISATTSPSSIGSAITRPSGAGFSTAAGSTTTNVTLNTITQADFSVAPTSGAYTLSYVLIDGVKTPPVSGTTYRVFKGTKINHSLSAVYATQKYTISTSKTGNGLIDPSVQVVSGSNKTINVVAGLGYQIASVTKADGSDLDPAVTFTGDTQSRAYTFTNVTENKTIKANFTVVPAVDARISTTAQTIALGTSLVIDGSASTSSVEGATYDWSVVGAPAGASVTATGATTTFNATATGTYTVRLDLSASGASDFATVAITVANAAELQAAQCTACHNDRSPLVVAAWNNSQHGPNTVSCQACHTGSHGTVPVLADDYVGSATCGVCHAQKYATFAQSGHNFKMTKIVNGQIPTFPFSNISGALQAMPATSTGNALGKPTSYDQVSYVVGGYGWKARWFDLNGYLVTNANPSTGNVQYNLANGSWSAYAGTNKKYDCGECHTTGWVYDADGNGQDNLPGMYGTWVQSGIQCEACHGAGKPHVLAPSATNITKVAAARTEAELIADEGYGLPVHCGECHTRDGERNSYGGSGSGSTALGNPYKSKYNQVTGTSDTIGGRIVAASGLGNHHQSYDELFGVDPDNIAAGGQGKHLIAGVSCGACHDPHKTTKYQSISGDGLGVDVACTSCHEVTFSATGAAHSNADCIACHMPKLTKSAISTGVNAAGKTLGDVKTHIFKIDLSQTAQFNTAGTFMKPYITPDYACGSCHSAPATKVANLGASFGGKIHGSVIYKHEGAAISSSITPPTTGNTCGTCHGAGPTTPSYVGAANCAGCHADTHAQWADSFHTLKATYGPGFEGQSAGNANIHPWVVSNWSNLTLTPALLPHAVLDSRTVAGAPAGYREAYVSKEASAVSDVAIVVGQTRKQRYAVYDSGAARSAVYVAYSNNDGIDWNIKTLVAGVEQPYTSGTAYKRDGSGGTPVEVAWAGNKSRAGYKFLMIEVDLTKASTASPAAKAANYGEHKSWQEKCIDCHTTGFNKAAWDAAKAGYTAATPTTTDLKGLYVSDIRISCEACHGPGEGHNVINPTELTGEARQMVCEQCHTRSTSRIDSNAEDKRGFTISANSKYEDVYKFTRPVWGSGNRNVSIDGKGRRDHQQSMDIRLSQYIHTEVQGKASSYHGSQACFDCHGTHNIGSDVSLTQFDPNGRGHLKVASDSTGLIRLKQERMAMCGSCHTGDGTSTLPGSITAQQALDRLNGATGWPAFSWPKDGVANWTNEGGRGSRNQHLFNTNAAGKVMGLEPSEYVWSVLTTNLGSTTASHYTAIWPWEKNLPEFTTNRTIVYGPLSGPPAPRP